MNEPQIDDCVIEACRRGDRMAFQTLFDAYKDRVYSIALHFSGNETLARDITQQVFLKLFTQISQFRGSAEFSTWLYRMVVNVCVDEHRSRSRFLPFSQTAEPFSKQGKGNQEERLLRRQLTEAVKGAVGDLNPKIRLVVVLKYVEGLSYEEIAAALGISAGTVASRLNRAHRLLAEKLAHLRNWLGS